MKRPIARAALLLLAPALIGVGAQSALAAGTADLAVQAHAKKHAPVAACSGDPLRCPTASLQFRVVVRNLGPDAAKNVLVRLSNLDDRDSLRSVDCSSRGVLNPGPPDPPGANGCSFATLPVGAQVAVRFHFAICCPFGQPDEMIEHAVDVSSDTTDPNRANNQTSAITRLSLCGAVLKRDTTLTADLVGCAGDGLVIGRSGITLDLAGHSISGSGAAGSVGIRNPGFDRVRIVNSGIRGFDRGRVSGFDLGLTLTDGANGNRLQLRDVRVEENRSDGILVSRSHRNRIEGSVVAANAGHGILLRDARRNLVQGNTVQASNFFSGETPSGSASDIANITLIDSDRNRVVDNDISVSNATGILLSGADGNQIRGNLAGFIESDGNGGFGIALFESDDNRISDNTTSDDVLGGIFVAAGSRRNRLTGNIAPRNRAAGIRVEDPDTTIADNSANDNVGLGIEAVAGVRDGGGNSATGNGDPRQCVNVVCRPAADLAVTARATPSAREGQEFRLRATVRNLGPDAAGPFGVIIGMADDVELISVDCGQGSEQTLSSCEFEGLAVGAQLRITARLRVLSDAVAGRVFSGAFINYPAAVGTPPDPFSANDSSFVETEVIRD